VKKLFYIVVSLITIFVVNVTPCLAGTQVAQTDTSGFSPIQSYQQQVKNEKKQNKKNGEMSPASSDANTYTIPNQEGTLTSNVYMQTLPTISGDTYQYNYQVSAVYSGNCTVERIRTTWQGSADMKTSGSISLGLGDSVSASSSSSWQNIKTVTKYYENTDGAKTAWYSSNMIIAPSSDYEWFTVALVNTALVKLKGDAMVYQYSAST